MGFQQGVSGLNASSSNLDVIGNNVANSGTVGFKAGSVLFADVYAGSRVGLGTQVAGVSQNFTQGAVQTSSRALDVAITNGDGFFRLASPSGEVSYSRNGQFTVDKDNFIINSGGLRLTGYQVGANGSIAGGTPAPLQLPATAMAPNATTKINAQYNIDSRSTVPTTTPFNSTDSTSFNYQNAVTGYDSLGNPHEITNFFVKTGANAWDVYQTVDGGASSNIGSLAFDASGKMTAPASGSLAPTTVPMTNGANPMVFSVNLTGTTQFGNDNAVAKQTQDGYTSGSLTAFAINPDGTVTGKYSNEQTKTLGQIVLTSFANPDGLQSKGGNVWAETAASGQPLVGTPGAGTKVGALTSGALESSNVDLTAELVNMIIAQRTYQANAQTVKTQDQVMQTLVSMR
ncbi:flagellar hook protein flgE [Collimonas arenae]|uniref:Flagellar hook protein FlgE n=1 Tax=Collimonas arenae TaxID=279058 RepID=A0A127QGJ4_9BURK|nr:flagellar hook protein FlgE [Collimonas arenae]AMO98835.1 flagellar hook protein flgE [Collimonas arenae]AMP08732.1 flagellar hook protein flgE [Collimonas arenae]